jgi:ubiquinone/menaquinone biosynthesis C-methylase UbiE
MVEKALFDEWPERYEQWFKTPIGKLVQKFEGELITELLNVKLGEKVLDAGCGTGVFTVDFLIAGVHVVGLDISAPMLNVARKKATDTAFVAVQGDMRHLPFRNESFDKAVSITALEFIADAKSAIDELFRVTKPGGLVVVATLNSLSPWAVRRGEKTQRGQRHILEAAFFRSPQEILALNPIKGITKTAIFFQQDDEPAQAIEIEKRGKIQALETGAFVAVCWRKP